MRIILLSSLSPSISSPPAIPTAAPPVCRGACEKCCGVSRYDDDALAMDDSVGVDSIGHHHHHPDMEEVVHMGQHQLSEGEQAALAAAAVAAAAAAAPLPTVPVNVGVGVLPGPGEDDHVGKRRRLEHDGEHSAWSNFQGHLN